MTKTKILCLSITMAITTISQVKANRYCEKILTSSDIPVVCNNGTCNYTTTVAGWTCTFKGEAPNSSTIVTNLVNSYYAQNQVTETYNSSVANSQAVCVYTAPSSSYWCFSIADCGSKGFMCDDSIANNAAKKQKKVPFLANPKK